jgi:hypothetical protein
VLAFWDKVSGIGQTDSPHNAGATQDRSMSRL